MFICIKYPPPQRDNVHIFLTTYFPLYQSRLGQEVGLVLQWRNWEEYNEETLHKGIGRVGGYQKKVPRQLTTLPPLSLKRQRNRGVSRTHGVIKTENTTRSVSFRRRNVATAHLWPGRQEAEGIHTLLPSGLSSCLPTSCQCVPLAKSTRNQGARASTDT